jgi:CheY-like chemotaxis protein
MPFMDGYSAAKKIRKYIKDYEDEEQQITSTQNERLYIIAITGHVEPEYIKKALDAGMDKVYPKPFPIIELGNILIERNFITHIPDMVYQLEQN